MSGPDADRRADADSQHREDSFAIDAIWRPDRLGGTRHSWADTVEEVEN